jgi:hypothetical protein
VRENLGDFRKSIQILTFLSPLPHVLLPFTKTNVLHFDLKKDVWNKILNIKPCMGHISRTCEYCRKSMIIGEKNTDLKRLTGRLKLRFLTNWATSLKPRRRSRPLRLVWWVLDKPITNTAWVRTRLCKLQKRVHSTRSHK